MTQIETFLLLLNIIGGISGLILAWKNHRSHANSTLFNDAMELAKNRLEEINHLRQDNERLESKLEEERKRTLEARFAEATAEQRLAEARELFEHKLDEIERGIKAHLDPPP